jgi:hypothetical protein
MHGLLAHFKCSHVRSSSSGQSEVVVAKCDGMNMTMKECVEGSEPALKRDDGTRLLRIGNRV